MIKKTTIATFRDGDYAGEYDWQGGIPLSVNEIVDVSLNAKQLRYKLVDKATSLTVTDDEQLVVTHYWFELTA
jgi:hypothetical protein